MSRTLLFALLLLPGLAQAAICKTVGPDGVVSFTNLPGSECPQGSVVPGYERPAAPAESAGAVDTAVRARQVKFAGYDAIGIVSPEDGETVRSNEGKVPVVVALEPGIQPSHFITAYVDGRTYKGRYGSSEITLAGVDRGTHRMYVTVRDSKGKTLIKSAEISFTVLKVSQELIVNPITGDDYVDENDPRWVKILGCYECAEGSQYADRDKRRRQEDRDKEGWRDKDRGREVIAGPWVTLWFPVREWESKPVRVLPITKTIERVIDTDAGSKTVVETYNWMIKVPRAYLQAEAAFEARVRLVPTTYENLPAKELPFETIPIASRTTSTHTVDPRLFGRFEDDRWQKDGSDQYLRDQDYFEADQDTEFKPLPSQPGKDNPAYSPGAFTPGKLNPSYTN